MVSAQKPKRKAPPPPRPPPPDLSARSKSTSSVEVKPPAETMEPVYAQVKKKPSKTFSRTYLADAIASLKRAFWNQF